MITSMLGTVLNNPHPVALVHASELTCQYRNHRAVTRISALSVVVIKAAMMVVTLPRKHFLETR